MSLHIRSCAAWGLSEAQLIGVYEQELAKVERWLAEQANFEVLLVDFNDLVRDPAPVAQAVAAFVPVDLDAAAMAGVVEGALYRQRS